MARLGVNIDHVATLRQIRRANIPDLALAALFCEKAGADSIVVHLREDRRHIQDNDLKVLKKKVKSRLNLEMSFNPDILKIACRLKPDQATIVPEKRRELTTEGGLDVVANFNKVKEACEKLAKYAIPVSLFINPDQHQIDAAWKTGARRIELHTGRYADAKNKKAVIFYLSEIKTAARYAANKGFQVFAGHGLDYQNIRAVADIKVITEFNIGYSIVCRAISVGLSRAVKEMKALIR